MYFYEDDDKKYRLSDLVEIHFIEIPKFEKLEIKDLETDRLQRRLTFFNKDL